MIDLQALARKHGATEVEFYNFENITTKDFVKKLRNDLGMTQSYFAKVLGVSKKTIEKWEQGINKITGATSLLLYVISIEPEILTKYAFRDTSYTLPTDFKEQKNYRFSPSSNQKTRVECFWGQIYA